MQFQPRMSYSQYSCLQPVHYETRTPSPATRLAVSRYLNQDSCSYDPFLFNPARVPVNHNINVVTATKEEPGEYSETKGVSTITKGKASTHRSIMLLLLLLLLVMSTCYLSIKV